MTCEVCGQHTFRDDKVDKTFQVNGKIIMVEDVPTTICTHCSDATFTAEVAEQLRRHIHEPHTPDRVIETEVFQFHAA